MNTLFSQDVNELIVCNEFRNFIELNNKFAIFSINIVNILYCFIVIGCVVGVFGVVWCCCHVMLGWGWTGLPARFAATNQLAVNENHFYILFRALP